MTKMVMKIEAKPEEIAKFETHFKYVFSNYCNGDPQGLHKKNEGGALIIVGNYPDFSVDFERFSSYIIHCIPKAKFKWYNN